MKLLTISILSIFLFSCNGNKILNNNDKVIKKTMTTKEKNEIDKIKDEVKSDEFVYLFFNKSNFQSKPTIVKTVNKEVIELNPNDYKVIVDWLVEDGTRQIKLKNLVTGEIFLVKDGDKTGEIVLLERNLFDYKFRIGNQTLKVKR